MKMRLGGIVLIAAALWLAGCASLATASDPQAATEAWAEAFKSRDPERIANLYDTDAVLWGTRSTKLAYDHASIVEYYTGMFPESAVAFGEHRLRVYGGTAIDTGTYTVSYVRDGAAVVIPARFSLTYRLHGGKWLIVDHHSSLLPAAR